ncbi:cytochrome P450 [Russula aff. rugulosa BPL654]|nr:cytochrome P450 [Russula aff. rugulosa BPL654]
MRFQLDAIPTIGFSDPLLSYFSALQFYYKSIPMLKEGYEKTRPGLFKIARFRRWMVLVTGSELIDDVRKAPDDVLSNAPASEVLQTKYTMSLLNPNDEYHTDIVRSQLTRNIAATFKEVREELIMGMDDLIPTHEDEWVKVPILDTLRRVVCRATNRIFVGAPLCRDRDYQTLNLNFAAKVVTSGLIIGMFPEPLKPIVLRMVSDLPSQIRREIEFIRPLVEERFAKMEEYGDDWDDKPNDMLMWLMSEAKGVERSIEGLARRMLLINFVSIHTTSSASTVTQTFYRLLANPEYIEPLREEVDAVIREEGWTKAGIDKMYKIDSFLRETQRLDGVTVLSMRRRTLRPFTFSNGVTVPAGTYLSVPTIATQTDERTCSNPDEFDGFRFANLRDREGATATSRYQMVSASSEHLVFGLGRHTCPGRFFSVNEIKTLFAYIIATYDFKLEEGQDFPRRRYIGEVGILGAANVMFRTRQK